MQRPAGRYNPEDIYGVWLSMQSMLITLHLGSEGLFCCKTGLEGMVQQSDNASYSSYAKFHFGFMNPGLIHFWPLKNFYH